MAKHPLPDADEIRKLLDYNPDTGIFTWKIRTVEGFIDQHWCNHWNSKWAGKRAGNINSAGYCIINFLGRQRKAHRLAWLIVNGRWPPEQIDHINGDKSDNRIANLREATRRQNAINTPKKRSSNNPYKNIYKRGKRWAVYVSAHKNMQYVGLFRTPEEAHKAYCMAARKFHGEFFNRGH